MHASAFKQRQLIKLIYSARNSYHINKFILFAYTCAVSNLDIFLTGCQVVEMVETTARKKNIDCTINVFCIFNLWSLIGTT